MPKVVFDLPADIKDIINSYSEINWNEFVQNSLWNYAKKIKMMDAITKHSELKKSDVDALDHEIKKSLRKHYKI